MSKKLGIVQPEPAPVDPFKNKAGQGLGAVVAREVSVQPAAPPQGLGTVKTDSVVVNVTPVGADPIGLVRQVVAQAPPPPPPPPPVGVIQDRTPTLSTVPVAQNAQPVGIVVQPVLAGPNSAPPPPSVGQVHEIPPLYPPAPLQAAPASVGKVVENVVNVQPPVPTNEPQKVVSIVQAPKPVIERPVELSPFRPEE